MFESNVGFPQGDGLSGPLYTVYLEEALKDVRKELNYTPSHHEYTRQNPTVANPPPELIYADDTDFITRDKRVDNKLKSGVVKDTLKKKSLYVNDDKTESLVLKRGDRNTETWRESKKLGSLLGDMEDITRRKQLAIAAFRKMNQVWIKGHKKINIEVRL